MRFTSALRLSRLRESPISTENSHTNFHRVHDLLPCVPLDLVVQIHFGQSNARDLFWTIWRLRFYSALQLFALQESQISTENSQIDLLKLLICWHISPSDQWSGSYFGCFTSSSSINFRSCGSYATYLPWWSTVPAHFKTLTIQSSCAHKGWSSCTYLRIQQLLVLRAEIQWMGSIPLLYASFVRWTWI